MKQIDTLNKNLKLSKTFGKNIYLYDFCSKITKKDFFYQKKNDYIIDYLEKKYESIIKKHSVIENDSEVISDTCPIWIFWYQGFENAPELVQNCLKQIEIIAGKHPIIKLTKKNYKEYVNIPREIINKFENGIISLVNYSDILRTSLLADHGGIWMDATIFIVDSIDDYLNSMSFFSINNHLYDTHRYVSNYRWTGFFMASGKNNILMHYLKDIFYSYWIDHNELIDYFLIDYLIVIGYKKINNIKIMIDKIPYNNPDLYWLNQNLSETYDNKKCKKIFDTTKIFKMNWRQSIKKNENNIYSKIFSKL